MGDGFIRKKVQKVVSKTGVQITSDRLSKSVAGSAQAFMGRKRPVAASFMQSAWLLFPLRAIAVSHHQRIQHVF